MLCLALYNVFIIIELSPFISIRGKRSLSNCEGPSNHTELFTDSKGFPWAAYACPENREVCGALRKEMEAQREDVWGVSSDRVVCPECSWLAHILILVGTVTMLSVLFVGLSLLFRNGPFGVNPEILVRWWEFSFLSSMLLWAEDSGTSVIVPVLGLRLLASLCTLTNPSLWAPFSCKTVLFLQLESSPNP